VARRDGIPQCCSQAEARKYMRTKLPTNSFLSASAVFLFSNVLAAATPFVLLPILTRYLSPAEYGQVAIFQALVTGLAAIIGISADSAAGVKYYDSHITPTELKSYIGSCMFVLVVTSALALLLSAVFLRPISGWLALRQQWLPLSVVVASANLVVSLRMVQWQVRNKPKKFGMFKVSQSLLNMLVSLILVVSFSLGSEGRILAMSLVPVAFALLAIILLRRDEMLGFAYRGEHVRDIVAYGVPLIPHSIGYFLLSSVDRFVINDKLGTTQVGMYIVAVQLVAASGLVFDAINSAYVPWLFERLKRNEAAEKRQIVRRTLAYFLFLLVAVALAFTFGGRVLVLIAGQRYAEAGRVVGWLALGWAFYGMYLMVTNYIFFSKRTGLLSASTILAGTINIGFLLVFVPHMGIIGAGIAFAISSGVKFIMTWYVSQLSFPMPWFSFRSNLQ
jgi:O-antigen/teichoic acid export membrane protein